MFNRRTLLIGGLAAIGGIFLPLSIYCLHLSGRIESRFAGVRWQVPSRVYSDSTLLFPGQYILRSALLEKLQRLNYRQVDGQPSRKGEMHTAAKQMDIFLHDARLPSGDREGFPLRIQFVENQIESIQRVMPEEELDMLEIEPEELSLFFGSDRERRQLISIREVPAHLVHAVMAAEDAEFYQHHGVSLTGILRAVLQNLRSGRIAQGGSTITQQLAKNFFLTPDKTISRKLKEMLIALFLEARYEKDEILEMYLNEIYLGQNGSQSVNGIGEAAAFYFDKPVSELTVIESAAIAGLIKGPNLYSPYINRTRCRTRRNQVLRAMESHGWLSTSDADAMRESPIQTAGFQHSHRKAPYFVDYLRTQLSRLYSREDLSSLGLSIYTTLDTMVQEVTEKALEKGLQHLEADNPGLKRSSAGNRLQGAAVVVHPRTGNILALVGGRNYPESQFNRISQARRQTGSLFKPFVYIAALDRFTPADLFSNAPKSYPTGDGEWTPQNFKPEPEEPVSMRYALAHSQNRPTVDLAMQVGLEKIIKTARIFGLSTPLEPYPSIALGAFEAVPLEMARAYCALAADGVLPYLLALKDVVDMENRVLNRRHTEIKRIVSPAKAYIVTSMLQTAVQEGTAKSLLEMGIRFPVAGKTGTSSDYRDAWFAGYTPDILALIWVGFDNGDSIQASGSVAALPIWAEIVKNIPQHLSGSDFKRPPGVVSMTVCKSSGLLPSKFGCPQLAEEIFLEGNAPKETCTLHGIRIFDNIIEKVKKLAP